MEDSSMHSLCSDGYLLDLETKPKMKGKQVIFTIFQSTIRPSEQPTRLG